nr:MAG TPA: hypothetical protein [Caudoviricetes sp.]
MTILTFVGINPYNVATSVVQCLTSDNGALVFHIFALSWRCLTICRYYNDGS